VCEAEVTAKVFTDLLMADHSERGVKISKIIPAKREALLIVVANDAGMKRILSGPLWDCPSDDTLQTRAIRLENRDVHEVTRLLDDVKSARGRVEADEAWGGLRITDLPTEANFLVHIARRLDKYPASRPKLQVRGVLADVLAEMFRRSRSVAPCHGKYSVENIDPACRAHATAWAIGPQGDDKRMVVVADEAGYAEING
jgi:type II secretory pathway component GspD/PulD (secretin)